MYFVYNRVVFEQNGGAPNDQEKTPQYVYYHQVVHHNPGIRPGSKTSKSVIMKSKMTPCNSDAKRQDITSYIGGVFELNNGSRLFVEVYSTNVLKPMPHLNYFGAHMI